MVSTPFPDENQETGTAPKPSSGSSAEDQPLKPSDSAQGQAAPGTRPARTRFAYSKPSSDPALAAITPGPALSPQPAPKNGSDDDSNPQPEGTSAQPAPAAQPGQAIPQEETGEIPAFGNLPPTFGNGTPHQGNQITAMMREAPPVVTDTTPVASEQPRPSIETPQVVRSTSANASESESEAPQTARRSLSSLIAKKGVGQSTIETAPINLEASSPQAASAAELMSTPAPIPPSQEATPPQRSKSRMRPGPPASNHIGRDALPEPWMTLGTKSTTSSDSLPAVPEGSIASEDGQSETSSETDNADAGFSSIVQETDAPASEADPVVPEVPRSSLIPDNEFSVPESRTSAPVSEAAESSTNADSGIEASIGPFSAEPQVDTSSGVHWVSTARKPTQSDISLERALASGTDTSITPRAETVQQESSVSDISVAPATEPEQQDSSFNAIPEEIVTEPESAIELEPAIEPEPAESSVSEVGYSPQAEESSDNAVPEMPAGPPQQESPPAISTVVPVAVLDEIPTPKTKTIADQPGSGLELSVRPDAAAAANKASIKEFLDKKDPSERNTTTEIEFSSARQMDPSVRRPQSPIVIVVIVLAILIACGLAAMFFMKSGSGNPSAQNQVNVEDNNDSSKAGK